MIKVVLFDLDGTLLPMDQEVFTKTYFKLLAKKLAPLGYEPEQLIKAIWAGTAAMVKNNGDCVNEEAFWKKFCEFYGEKALEDKPIFDKFYEEEFQQAKQVCGFNENAVQAVKLIKEKGIRVALATNPIFPAVATESRIKWAGFEPSDFELYTTYDNSSHCKPNPEYYKDILKKLNCKAEECLMVGNDVNEDMIAEKIGMQVFLLDDCIINKDSKDISCYNRGGFEKLMETVKEW